MIVERARIADLAEAWGALLPRARTRNAFVTWPFLATWWEQFRREREERTFVARRTAGGDPVAIVPLYVESRRTRLGRVPVLRNIGFGDVVNPDFLDALVAPGAEAEVARALAPQLAADAAWQLAEFSELAADGSLVRMVPFLAERLGTEAVVERRATCPYIPLPASYDAFLASCNPHFRQQIRRYRRVIERELAPQWKRTGEDVDVETGIELLTRLHQERMEATERGGNFRKADYADFQRAVSARLAEAGDLYFWILFLEGSPAAAHYGFLHDGVYYGYQMGFAVRYAKYSPGHYMTGVVMEKLIALGAREMNLLRGTDAWKFRWTEKTRSTVAARVRRAGVAPALASLRAELSQSPSLVLRSLIGRDAFDEVRAALGRFRA
jgi:CelD/BcsL family acetyltransferase involved in cellulose biosynthesis